jgi:outer membrane protein TolC
MQKDLFPGKRFSIIALGCILLLQSIDATGVDSDHRAASSRTGPASLLPQISMTDPPETPILGEDGLRITIREAILMTLANNRSLVVEKYNPPIQATFEEQEGARFDPVLDAGIAAERKKGQQAASSGTGNYVRDRIEGELAVEQYFPSGTTLEVRADTEISDTSTRSQTFTETRLGLTVTQALLQDFGRAVNLVRIKQARLGTAISQYELRGFSEALLAQVETAYWNYALAQRQIEIVEESLKLVQQQLGEAEEMMRVGRMAESELAAVRAEVALQQQGLINAKSNGETQRLRLLRLLNPPGQEMWSQQIALVHQPTLPEIQLDSVEKHVQMALRMRAEINQTKLEIQRGELQVVRTKNGLLPKLELFINLGKSGYAESFGASVGNISEENYDIMGGIRFQYPLRNRDAEARHRRSRLEIDQAQKALDNLIQLAELDVRSAYIEVTRSKEQIGASKATRVLEEEKLRAETEKFKVGLSTGFLVSQAQRDLLASRINEVQALTNYLKALIELYHKEGSGLLRRGIIAPGQAAVDL